MSGEEGGIRGRARGRWEEKTLPGVSRTPGFQLVIEVGQDFRHWEGVFHHYADLSHSGKVSWIVERQIHIYRPDVPIIIQISNLLLLPTMTLKCKNHQKKRSVQSPYPRKINSNKYIYLQLTPHNPKNFLTLGINHLRFWCIDSPRLGGPGTILIPSDPDAVQTTLPDNSGENHNGARTSHGGDGKTKFIANVPLPTFLCATFAKHQKGNVGVLVAGTVGGSVWFWKGRSVEGICKGIHKVSLLVLL